MNKNVLLATAVAASLAGMSAPSFAGYMCGTNSLTGYVAVTNFADNNPAQFNATLRDLNGTVNCQVPPSANYYDVSVSGTVGLDLDLNGSIDMGGTISNPLTIFSGALDLTGITPGPYAFSFTPGVIGAPDNQVVPFGFTIDYDGNTSTTVLNFINGLLGAPVFTNPDGAGRLVVAGNIGTDGATMTFTESNLTWVGFGALLAGADSVLGPNSRNIMDANFVLSNVSVHIPEPTSLALLGLGLMGLAAARRRRSV